MLHIVKDNIKTLRERSVDVTLPLAKHDKKTLDAMLSYLKNTQDPEWRKDHPACREGIGLAAPQIGINKRMLVIHYQEGDEEKPIDVSYELVNPKIIENSVKLCFLESGEGCLSVDAPHPGKVYRPFRIKVAGYEAITGQDVTITAEGFDAIVLQHEIDHLNGVLFYDHIDKLDPDKVIPDAIAI
jgi:peptide deformylase